MSAGGVRPGEVVVADEPVELFVGANLIELEVMNTGDRPVQVGSHYHFAEANDALRFERDAAVGCRLAVPAGTSVRFEPGLSTTVRLVAYGGAGRTLGFRGLYTEEGST